MDEIELPRPWLGLILLSAVFMTGLIIGMALIQAAGR